MSFGRMLRSEPRFIPKLKAGQMAEVKESELFDYIRRYPGGSEDGKEISKLLLYRQKINLDQKLFSFVLICKIKKSMSDAIGRFFDN